MMESDPHEEIARLEEEIELLGGRIESCRKFILAGQIALAAGGFVLVAMLLAGAASAQSPDISARRLLSSWKGEDPSMRLVAEVIASAFSSGLSWRGSLAGKEVYCPPPGLKGHEIMVAFERFLEDNPDMAERPYGDAMAATLSRAFACQTH